MTHYAYGYARVSTESQAESGPGLDAQREAVENYYQLKLRAQGFLWGDVAVDSAVSGRQPFTERRAGGELDRKLKAGDCIILAKLDRGFRRLSDLVQMLDAWSQRGIGIHVLDLGIDTTTDVGRLITRILGAIAEFERDRTRERTREAIAVRRRQGKAINGHAGYGFRWSGPKGKRVRVADEHDQAVIGQIVSLRRAGLPYERIYWQLRKLGANTSTGREWSMARIRRAYRAELRRLVSEEEKRSA